MRKNKRYTAIDLSQKHFGKNRGEKHLANEFIVSGDNIVVNVPYAEAYIPVELFKNVEKESQLNSAVAFMDGSAVTTVGIFNMRLFPTDDPSIREKVPIRTFNYPSPITTYPDDVVKMKLTLGDIEEQEYSVLQYTRGSIMMPVNNPKDSGNCEKFLNMMMRGKIPNTIPYSHILEIWNKNFQINGIAPGVPSVILQAIIAEQARCKDDPTIPFRKHIGVGKAGENDYVFANVRTVASYTSVFNALTFEDMSQMLTTSINMTRSGTTQNKSPVEKVLSM